MNPSVGVVLLLLVFHLFSCTKSDPAATSSTTCDPSSLSLGLPLQNFSTLSGDFIGNPYGVADAGHRPGGHGGTDFLLSTQYNVIAPAAGTVRGIVEAKGGQSLQITGQHKQMP